MPPGAPPLGVLTGLFAELFLALRTASHEAAGFEYTPVDLSAASANSSDDGDPAARAERSGFGISVYYGNIELAREDEPGGGASGTNPNEEYGESLCEGEIGAFFAALYGTEEELAELREVEVDPESGEESTVTSGAAGCEGKAAEAAFQGFSVQSVEVMEQLYTEIQERVDADLRIVKLQQERRTWGTRAVTSR